MKKLVAILIGICLIAFGIGFLTLNLSNNKWNGKHGITIEGHKNNKKNKNSINIDEKSTESLDRIDKIDIEVPYANVNIKSENRKDLSLHYYGHIDPSIKTELTTRKSGNELIILAKNNKRKISHLKDIDLNLDIIIPSSYTNNLEVELNLGSMVIEDLNLNKLDVEGDLGNIIISNVSTKELEADCSAGNIEIENVSSLKNELSSNMGNIIAKNLSGNLEAESNMGNIELEYDEFDYNIEGKVNMGNMEIILPKNSNLSINTDVNLGKIKTNFPMEISEKSNSKLKGKAGSGKNKLSFTVDMGNLEIKSR